MNVLAVNDETRQTGLAGKVCIKIGTRFRLVTLMNIMYVRASNEYIDIAMATGEILHTKEQIAHFENELPQEWFIRVHRSFIVNCEHIKEMRAKKGDYELILNDGTTITSGFTYRTQVADKLLMGLGRRHKHLGERLNGGRTHSTFILDRYSHGEVSKTRIRPAKPGDEYTLSLLGQSIFMRTYTGALADVDILEYCASSYTPGTFRTWLENTVTRIWIAELERSNVSVGYLVLTPLTLPLAESQKGDLEIQRIYLLDQVRGSGLGTRLLREAVNYAKQSGYGRLTLGDYIHNDQATAFYRHSGFQSLCDYHCRIGDHEYHDIAFGLEV